MNLLKRIICINYLCTACILFCGCSHGFKEPHPVYSAHRGLHDDKNGDNTLSAIKAAHQKGYPCVEVDVWKTKDNVYIIRHDERILFNEKMRRIEDLNYEEVVQAYNGKELTLLSDCLNYVYENNLMVELHCKNRVDEVANYVVDSGLSGRAYYNCFEEQYQIILDKDPKARFHISINEQNDYSSLLNIATKDHLVVSIKAEYLDDFAQSIKWVDDNNIPLSVWHVTAENIAKVKTRSFDFYEPEDEFAFEFLDQIKK